MHSPSASKFSPPLLGQGRERQLVSHVTPCRAIPRADGHSPRASPSVRVRLCGGARLAGGEDIRDHVVSSALLLVDAFPPSLDRRSPATNSPNLRPFLQQFLLLGTNHQARVSLCLSECQTAACSSGVQTTCRPAVWQRGYPCPGRRVLSLRLTAKMRESRMRTNAVWRPVEYETTACPLVRPRVTQVAVGIDFRVSRGCFASRRYFDTGVI